MKTEKKQILALHVPAVHAVQEGFRIIIPV